MKQLKRPNRRQKIEIKALGLNPEKWRVERDTPEEFVLVHHESGRVTIKKGA